MTDTATTPDMKEVQHALEAALSRIDYAQEVLGLKDTKPYEDEEAKHLLETLAKSDVVDVALQLRYEVRKLKAQLKKVETPKQPEASTPEATKVLAELLGVTPQELRELGQRPEENLRGAAVGVGVLLHVSKKWAPEDQQKFEAAVHEVLELFPEGPQSERYQSALVRLTDVFSDCLDSIEVDSREAKLLESLHEAFG